MSMSNANCAFLIPILVRRGVRSLLATNKSRAAKAARSPQVDINEKDDLGRTAIKNAIRWYKSDRVILELLRFKPRLDEEDQWYIKRNLGESVLRTWEKARARGRWSIIKSCVKLLSLHMRAVITANHPMRLLERGVFQLT